VIIFAGIVSQAPSNQYRLLQSFWDYNLWLFVLITIFTVVVIELIQEGTRRIQVQ
jgi:preprotein translocase subunit SecY